MELTPSLPLPFLPDLRSPRPLCQIHHVEDPLASQTTSIHSGYKLAEHLLSAGNCLRSWEYSCEQDRWGP